MNPKIEKLFKLPNRQKVALLVLIVLVLGAALFFALFMPQQRKYAVLKQELDTKQSDVADKTKFAKELPKFKKEYEELSAQLQVAIQELPNQKEIPSLLVGITGAGKSTGLDFNMFKPKPEEPKDFYAAVPIDIAITGSFMQVANFFINVSKLPRIVNLNNVNIAEAKDVGGRMQLKVSCLATTFRFLSETERKALQAKDAAKNEEKKPNAPQPAKK